MLPSLSLVSSCILANYVDNVLNIYIQLLQMIFLFPSAMFSSISKNENFLKIYEIFEYAES